MLDAGESHQFLDITARQHRKRCHGNGQNAEANQN